MRNFLSLGLLNLIWVTQACGQHRISSELRAECVPQKISFDGVHMEYPLTVKQAVKKYGLTYVSNAHFFKKLPDARQYRHELRLVFPTIRGELFDDGVPANQYLNRPVKGYEFYIATPNGADSLKLALEATFKSTFEERKLLTWNWMSWVVERHPTKPERTFLAIKVSPCLTIAMPTPRPEYNFQLIFFFMDMTDEEIALNTPG